MEDVAESQVYRLFLNTETGFPNILANSDKANTSWLVDYDSLFNRDNYNYKNCRLRYKLISQPSGSIDATANTGVLAINGLSSRYVSKNTHMLPLDIIVPKMTYTGTGTVAGTITGTAPSQTTSQTPALFTVRGQLIADTIATTGIDIDMPFGMTTLNPQFWQIGFGSNGNADNILQTLVSEYVLMLQFELYNPK
jgi:hypothetical protein